MSVHNFIFGTLTGVLLSCPYLFGQATSNSQLEALLPVESSTNPISGGPLVWKVLEDRVYPVSGSDGSVHLSYAAVFTNVYVLPVTIKAIEILDPDNDYQPTGTNQVLSGDDQSITGQLRPFALPSTLDGANFSTRVGPGEAGVVYFDVSYPNGTAIPRHLSHLVSMYVVPQNGQEQDFVVTDDSVPVSPRSLIVLSPPLRGKGWVDANGCCKQLSAHRGDFNPINGALQPAESFAIDFVQVNSNGVAFTGDGSNVTDYPYYDTDVLAAGAGTVVEVVNDMPDQVPNQEPVGITIQNAAGNHVIVDMGDGQYALYAHLAPYSTTVRVGDLVQQGQRIGLLGDSGNSDAPHLHFQVMDKPSALEANGLPFVFDQIVRQGRVTDSVDGTGDKFSKGIPLPISYDHGGLQHNTMPLILDVLKFK